MGDPKPDEIVVVDPADEFAGEWMEISFAELLEVQKLNDYDSVEFADGSDVHDQAALDRDLAAAEHSRAGGVDSPGPVDADRPDHRGRT